MGYFWFSFIQILEDLKRPSSSYKPDWGTPMDFVIGLICAVGVVVILGVWFVGIPYYLHVIQGFSGWATFGLWWLITAAVAGTLSLLNPDC